MSDLAAQPSNTEHPPRCEASYVEKCILRADHEGDHLTRWLPKGWADGEDEIERLRALLIHEGYTPAFIAEWKPE